MSITAAPLTSLIQRGWVKCPLTKVTSLTKALLCRLLSLARRPALGRVSVVPNFLHLRMMEATVFLGPSMLQTFFGTLPQICVSTQSCLGALRTIPSTSCLGFCSDMHLSTVGPYIDRCVPFQIMSNQLNFPQVDNNHVVETSQG